MQTNVLATDSAVNATSRYYNPRLVWVAAAKRINIPFELHVNLFQCRNHTTYESVNFDRIPSHQTRGVGKHLCKQTA